MTFQTEMTAQEVFTKVVTHLRAQGKQAKSEGACVYRGKDGLMCAVGCLIPDELYDPAVEGATVPDFYDYLEQDEMPKWRKASLRIGKQFPLIEQHSGLLNRLQQFHDDKDNWNETGFSRVGEQRLADLAYEHGLKIV